MILLAQNPQPRPEQLQSIGTFIFIIATIAVLVFMLVALVVVTRYFRLWLQSVFTRAGIGIFDLLGMTFRKVDPRVIVRSKVMAVQAGLGEAEGVTTRGLEAHYLAGGKVPLVIQALIAAHKAQFDLSFKQAAAIDLAGRNVLEAVQTSVYPKVIDCPARNSGKEWLDALAKNGIQLKVRARVTVRANLRQIIGGATEETIVAGSAKGSSAPSGSAETHSEVLANPDRISKKVLSRRLDSPDGLRDRLHRHRRHRSG